MAYLCYCIDRPNSAGKREQAKAEHFAYIERIIDQIQVAGPLRDKPGDQLRGSCIIYLTDDRETALQLLHNDPYYQAGIWQEVICQQFNAAAGNWLGGKTW